MRVKIYWIDEVECGRLGIMPRPRGGDWLEDEIRSLKMSGTDVVVSLLTSEEITELDLSYESACCDASGIKYVSFPISDRGVPASIREATDFVRPLATLIREGKSIVMHCRQGIGRSSLVAAAILILLAASGDEVFDRIERARGCPVPDTIEQRDWIARFSESFRSDTRIL